jgi:hypothetical protein
MAALDSLARSLAEGPRVVAVTSDALPTVTRYVRRRRLRLEVLLDPRGVLASVAPRRVIPSSYLFDAEGRLVAQHDGPVDWWSPQTLGLLRQAAGGASGPLAAR